MRTKAKDPSLLGNKGLKGYLRRVISELVSGSQVSKQGVTDFSYHMNWGVNLWVGEGGVLWCGGWSMYRGGLFLMKAWRREVGVEGYIGGWLELVSSF